MGTFRKDVLGNVDGKIGNVTGAQWKGKAVVRSRPGPRKKGSFSAKQQEQNAKFALMMGFLQQLNPLLNQTFDKNAKGMSGFNKAFAYNIVQAITGTFPDFTIDYSKVQLSRGSQAGAASATCTSPSAGQLVFSWSNTGGVTPQAEDLAYVAAYNQDINHWVYLQGVAQRKTGTITMDLPGLSGKAFHAWLGFTSSSGLASNSYYLGLVTLA